MPTENRHLFITPTLDGMIADLDTTKSREILTRFATKTLVPQTRFYTAIDLSLIHIYRPFAGPVISCRKGAAHEKDPSKQHNRPFRGR